MKRDPQIQFKSREEIAEFQIDSLHETLRYVASSSPYYISLFKRSGIDPLKIKSISDLSLLPTTDKQDLQMHNEMFLCVPREKIIDYVTTSGTLGEPVTFMLTENDLDRLDRKSVV